MYRLLPLLFLVGARLALAERDPAPFVSAPPAQVSVIALAGANASAPRLASSETAWGGPRSDQSSDQVVAYVIDATLDPKKHQVTGEQTLSWRNRSSQPIGSIYLHLYLNAFAGMGSTFMHETVRADVADGDPISTDAEFDDDEWGHIDVLSIRQMDASVESPLRLHFVQPDGGPITDQTVARVDLKTPIAPGATLQLKIKFLAQLPADSVRTGYFKSFHMVAQWFPKIAVLELPGERGADALRWNAHEFHANSEFYADFGRYDVTMHLPSNFVLGATGQLSGPVLTKNGISSYRYVQEHVVDFAWVADKNFAPPLQRTWKNPFDGGKPVSVRVLYPPEYAAAAELSMQATLDALAYFSKTLGSYPYQNVTVIVPPFNATGASGMEYPTLFTTVHSLDVRAGSPGNTDVYFTTVHEFGHQYFMGILASNEFEEPFLDEGLNEYWDQCMLRDSRGAENLAPMWLQHFGVNLPVQMFDLERAAAQLKSPSDPLGASSWHRLSDAGYWPIYSRTATVLRDLEALYGKPAMARAMQSYYQKWKFRHPSAADFKAVLQTQLGDAADVESRFAQHVYAATKMDDRLVGFASTPMLPQPGQQSVDAAGKRTTMTQDAIDSKIKQTQKSWQLVHPNAQTGFGPYPYQTEIIVQRLGASAPQTLQVTFADGSTRSLAWPAGPPGVAWQRFDLQSQTQAVSAQLDPGRKNYLDVSLLDNSKASKGNFAPLTRWGADIAAALQSTFAMLLGM
jgi:hypothetical protein